MRNLHGRFRRLYSSLGATNEKSVLIEKNRRSNYDPIDTRSHKPVRLISGGGKREGKRTIGLGRNLNGAMTAVRFFKDFGTNFPRARTRAISRTIIRAILPELSKFLQSRK